MLYCLHIKSRTAFFKIFLSVRRIFFSIQICFFHGISAGKYKFDELADHTDGMYTYTNASLAVTPQIAAFADLKQILDKIRMSDGKLGETQRANYFSRLYLIDCAVLSVNIYSCRKYGTLQTAGLSA